MASKITQKGATLFRSLEEETELRPIRDSRVNAALDINEVETSLRTLIEKTKKETGHTKELIKNISTTEINLDAKIAKRQEDLDRNSKRLNTLKQVRQVFKTTYFNNLVGTYKELIGNNLNILVFYNVPIGTYLKSKAVIFNSFEIYIKRFLFKGQRF